MHDVLELFPIRPTVKEAIHRIRFGCARSLVKYLHTKLKLIGFQLIFEFDVKEIVVVVKKNISVLTRKPLPVYLFAYCSLEAGLTMLRLNY